MGHHGQDACQYAPGSRDSTGVSLRLLTHCVAFVSLPYHQTRTSIVFRCQKTATTNTPPTSSAPNRKQIPMGICARSPTKVRFLSNALRAPSPNSTEGPHALACGDAWLVHTRLCGVNGRGSTSTAIPDTAAMGSRRRHHHRLRGKSVATWTDQSRAIMLKLP